jgi:hypothetical protein
MSNFAFDHHEKLKKRNYVLISRIEDHWARIAKGKLDEYIRQFGDVFNIVLITDPEANDGYLVIPFRQVKHCFTAETLGGSTDVEGSAGWTMSVLDDRLQITNATDSFPVAPFHAGRSRATLDPSSGRPTLGPPPAKLGTSERPAADSASVAERAEVERRTRGHVATENGLAEFLRAQGIEPRSPAAGEPDFDLAWEHDGVTYVAEVKSITDADEERQLQLGLGRVLRHRQALSAGGGRVVAVLVPERRPTDPSWAVLCEELGVVLMASGPFDLVLALARDRGR